MNSTTCWMIQTGNTFSSMWSTLWEVTMTFWVVGGILITINMAIRLETEAETQWITTKNLFRRLQLLNINKKIQLIIVVEWGQICTLRDEEQWRSLGPQTIWDVQIWNIWTNSSLGILISSTIMINITCCSNHYIQLWRIIHNSPEYSGTPGTTKWQPSTASNSSTLYTSSSPFQLLSWSTMPLLTSSRTHLCHGKQFWWLRQESQIICSLSTHHQSTTRTMITIWARRAYIAGNAGQDSLWGTPIYIRSGISKLGQGWSYHHRLFFFSAQLCALPPSLPFVIAHSCLLCYL